MLFIHLIVVELFMEHNDIIIRLNHILVSNPIGMCETSAGDSVDRLMRLFVRSRSIVHVNYVNQTTFTRNTVHTRFLRFIYVILLCAKRSKQFVLTGIVYLNGIFLSQILWSLPHNVLIFQQLASISQQDI